MSTLILSRPAGLSRLNGIDRRGAGACMSCRMLSVRLIAAGLIVGACAPRLAAEPIPQDPFADPVPSYVGGPATPERTRAYRVPQHPFMAPNGRSNIHDDAYQSDAYAQLGPLGRAPEVLSTLQAAECASLTFDGAGRIVAICVGVEGPRLVMMDAATLEVLASMPLPPRTGGGGGSPFSDFSGGGYFYLDQLDRAVVPTNTRQIWVVGETTTPLGAPGFAVERTYDLAAAVPLGDGIVSVLPDWSGRLWFVTLGGIVGTVDPDSGVVASRALAGEKIGNSFAVDETGGVYIVTDHSLYRFDATATGAPGATWREIYDRGTRLKPGQTNFGSGTTPTLTGRRYITITDNADPFMHVLVYKRARRAARQRFICSAPVFAAGAGATENSLIVARKSIVVENNYGYSGLTAVMNGATTEPGLARIDVRGRTCRVVWTSSERPPSVVSKLSLAAGLVYSYTKDPGPNATDAWYFTAIGFRTGATVFKRLVGTGFGYNNNFAPVTLGPDGTAYVGVLGGLTLIRDTE